MILLFSQLVFPLFSDVLFSPRFSDGFHARRLVTSKCNRSPAGFPMVSCCFPMNFVWLMIFRWMSCGFPMMVSIAFVPRFSYGFPARRPVTPRCNRSPAAWFSYVFVWCSCCFPSWFSDAFPKVFARFPYGIHARRLVTPRCHRSLPGFPMFSYGFPVVFQAGFPMLFRSFLHGFPMVSVPGDRLHPGVTGRLLVVL